MFLLGLYIIRVYSYFGQRYNYILTQADGEEGFLGTLPNSNASVSNNSGKLSKIENSNNSGKKMKSSSEDDTFKSNRFNIEYKSNNNYIFNQRELRFGTP